MATPRPASQKKTSIGEFLLGPNDLILQRTEELIKNLDNTLSSRSFREGMLFYYFNLQSERVVEVVRKTQTHCFSETS